MCVRKVAQSLLLALLALPGLGHGQAESTRRRDHLAVVGESQLDSLYAPLVYLMQEDERGIYPSLSEGGKRDFLRRFWARRDPTPGTGKNEAEAEFNARLAVVNRKFSERGATEIAGWRTDRGRIYLENGPPDITLTRRGLPGTMLPFEVWKYTRGEKQRKYCFVDPTWFGNYVLVYSTDPREPARSDWRQLLGDDGYEDAMQF
jgi:GWxTD domain-containing protein